MKFIKKVLGKVYPFNILITGKKNEYRIVSDKYNGYEVQIKYWCFPFIYLQCDNDGSFGGTNTSKLEGAKKIIEKHKKNIKKPKRKIYYD